MDPNSADNVVIRRQREGILGRWIRSIIYNSLLFNLTINGMVKYYDEDVKALGTPLYVVVYIWSLIFIFMIPIWTLLFNFTNDPSALPLNNIVRWMATFLGVYSIILFGFYGIKGFTDSSITIFPSIYAFGSMLTFFVMGICYIYKYCDSRWQSTPQVMQANQDEMRV